MGMACLTERGLLMGKGTIDRVCEHHQCPFLDEERLEEVRPADAPDAERLAVVFWHEGAQRHDADSGLVHTVRAASANMADVNVLGELLH